jgi:D-glycero-D-manno-heptose 1,7-bisphosphate phosphatase
MNKALFLDRDGTLIYDSDYLCDPYKVEIVPGTAEALQSAKDLGYLLFLFTNQSGVGRDYYDMDAVHAVNERFEALLGLPAPLFTEICIAPEKPDDPQVYRKPSPKFILEMIEKHDLDPAQCFMVGNGPADIMAGINAGITPIAISGGKPGQDPHTFPEVSQHNVKIFDGLKPFVDELSSS